MKSLQQSFSRLYLVLVPFLAICTGLASPSLAQVKVKQVPPVKSKDIADLSWLVGKWESKGQNSSFEEHWMWPRDGVMIGMGREMSGSKMSFFEYLRIEQRKDGLFYVAQPNGKTQTDFRLTHTSKNTLVFENPEHDFPKKIEYARGAGGVVTVRVSGDGTEKEKSFQHVLFRTRN